ncbi:MAG: hypothetical protein IT422_05120 [Pirellulaceae bacterium]|nr:hypothetical protein [Pirellulaceae bacterium]
MITLQLFDYPTGGTLRLYPADIAPTTENWAEYKVPMPEGTAEMVGVYSGAVDPSVSEKWVVFPSDSAPGGYATKLVGVLFDLTESLVHDLLEADPIIELAGGVQVLRIYKRGTSTELIPAKFAKQPGGAALTDPTTQRLAGYRE